MLPKNKADWFRLGQEEAKAAKINPYVNPTSWQSRAYCDGYKSVPQAAQITNGPIMPLNVREAGKSMFASVIMLKRFVIPDSWPTGAKAHALQLMLVDPLAPPKKIARHQRAIQRRCKRWGRPMNPELLAIVDELAE